MPGPDHTAIMTAIATLEVTVKELGKRFDRLDEHLSARVDRLDDSRREHLKEIYKQLRNLGTVRDVRKGRRAILAVIVLSIVPL